ncbi:MAG: hypothetical protein RQ868_04645 [Meiothermus sp.]|uniref:hypothetical protein n=1 Tax=Meiothermus sp. TaxID=1955249 RepID=UPI0028CCF788|nr:hypothetical protein [Meiothermus sp.]MDT7919860.1 hypothetical protein [Meiothermus sp.]
MRSLEATRTAQIPASEATDPVALKTATLRASTVNWLPRLERAVARSSRTYGGCSSAG